MFFVLIIIIMIKCEDLCGADVELALRAGLCWVGETLLSNQTTIIIITIMIILTRMSNTNTIKSFPGSTPHPPGHTLPSNLLINKVFCWQKWSQKLWWWWWLSWQTGSPGIWTPKSVLVEHQLLPSSVSTQLEWLVPFKSSMTLTNCRHSHHCIHP